MRLLVIACLISLCGYANADESRGRIHDHSGIENTAFSVQTKRPLPENSERMLPVEGFSFWGVEALPDAEAIIPLTQSQKADINSTVVRYHSGKSAYSSQGYLDRIQEVMERYKDRKNLRLNFIGHTDNEQLSARNRAIYGDNVGLSLARAEKAARYFQKQLNLDDEAISWEGKGEAEPIASNTTAMGMSQNRRIEVEVWFDEEVKPVTEVSRTMVCGLQPMCQVDPNDGKNAIRINNVIEPIRSDKPIEFGFARSDIPESALLKIKTVLKKLTGFENIRLAFVGHTDSIPVRRKETKRLYGDNLGLSQARAKEVADFFATELNLQPHQVYSTGYGDSQPVAGNDSRRGRSLNRRVELQIWYDKPFLKSVKNEQPPVVQWCDLVDTASDSVTRVQKNHDPRDAFELSPFRITVDGLPLDPQEASHTADVQRCTDVALEKAQIQVQYDNLLLKPRLAVSAWPSVLAYADKPETEVDESLTQFSIYSNYPAYISKAELRVFALGQSLQGEPLLTIPADEYLQGQWKFNPALFEDSVTGDFPSQLVYVARVYGHDSERFDETKPQRLWLRNELEQDLSDADVKAEKLVSYGENTLALQNINFDSGTITVNGIGVPDGHKVYVLGHEVPVDKKGSFVAQNIIPEGLHTVEVAVLDEQGNGQLFHRDLELTQSDWFYIGIADLTFGTRDTDGPASVITQDDRYDDNSYADGRLAFYTKGKTATNWEITASADTREEPLEDLFKNFSDKDPLVLFRRLDPDYYYPTFADDSTLEEDAPTQGKFYLKAQKNKSFGLWGNFESKILDSDLAQIDRALYGGQIHYESLGLTQYGEQKTQLDFFAAEPGTQSAREEYRGTGGSLYFLRHQDITVGSERIRIETRDKDTGLVVQRKSLTPGSDYDIDPIQGRVMLNSPLSASGTDGLLVRDASIAGNENYLIVSYEFTPGFDDLNELAIGGRASQWLGDHAEIGITSSKQEVNLIDQKLNAVDLTLRLNPSNYIKFEAAQSEGLAAEQRESIDGGFAFSDLQPSTNLASDQKADAGRVEAGFKLGKKGRATVFAQTREAGYSAPGQLTTTETEQYGAQANYSLTQDVSFNAKLAQKDEQLGDQNKSLDAEVGVDLSEHWKVDVGARYDEKQNNRLASPTDIGERTDMTVELGYNSLEKWTAYTFAQGTVDNDDTRDENSRGGVGGSYQVIDRLKVDGELSGGNTGTGAKLGSEYQATDRTQLYMAYALENQRSDTGLRGQRGNLSGGFKSRYTDTVSLYGEERYAYGDQPVGLTHAYGVDLAPTDEWNIGTSVETGKLKNQSGGEIKRLALGLNLGYSFEKIKYAGAVEYRDDESGGNDRVTWLLRNQMTYQNTADWRTIAKLNWSQSESSQGEFFDGDFTEAVWGYGYRPVDNDRINTLLKYTYFFNKPAPEQVSTQNTNSRFIQRSHILSADVSYDLTQRWTVGGKYAYKQGELAVDRVNPDYFRSRAHLLVLRGDWHVVRHWDFLIEGRMLELTDAEDRRSGFLTGIYRHFGSHLKLGLGYNFTDFSDDLTDLSFDSQGVFVNIVGKI